MNTNDNNGGVQPLTTLSVDVAAQWLARLAAADGVLSPNEKAVLAEFADTFGLPAATLLAAAEPAADSRAEVKLIDAAAANGLEFECHIVGLMRRVRSLTLVEWTGDKYYKGTYARSSLNPDLHLRLTTKAGNTDFHVECKWRHHWMKDTEGRYYWRLKEDNLERYRAFAAESRRKVYIAFGTGRTGGNPRSVYLVSLEELDAGILWRDIADSRYRFDDTPAGFIHAVISRLRSNRRIAANRK